MADTTKTSETPDKPEASDKKDKPATAEAKPAKAARSAKSPSGKLSDSTEEGPTPRKRSGIVRGLLVAAVVVIVGQGVILVSSGGLSKFLEPNKDEERIAALEAKLVDLEAADAEAAEKARGFASDLETRGSELSALSSSVSQLSQAGGLEGAEGIAADLQATQSMIAALEERLETFEAQTGEVDPLALPATGGDTNPGQQAQSSADVTQMKGALAALSERFASMNESLAATDGRIEALEETAPPENLDEILEGLNPPGQIEGAIEGLTARLAAIEEADPEGAARAAVLALSATELARAAATSRPFTTELEAFLALAPQNAFASQLRAFAPRGAPMPKTLLLEFDAAARAIAEAERIRAGGGLWNWVVNQFTALFSIRKVGELDGDDWQAVLARAENRIAIEDLAAAVSEVSALQGPAAKGAAPWLTRAEARASVDALITQLTTAIFADLITALERE